MTMFVQCTLFAHKTYGLNFRSLDSRAYAVTWNQDIVSIVVHTLSTCEEGLRTSMGDDVDEAAAAFLDSVAPAQGMWISE